MEHVVMVVPVDADVDEAEQVAEQPHAGVVHEIGEVRAIGNLQLQHHDRDDDGEDAVAERLQPAGPHGALPWAGTEPCGPAPADQDSRASTIVTTTSAG